MRRNRGLIALDILLTLFLMLILYTIGFLLSEPVQFWEMISSVFQAANESGNSGSSSSGGGTNVIGEYLLTTLAAITAYAIWDWRQSPFLVMQSISEKTEIHANSEPNPVYRLEIENIGKKAAEDCQSHIFMKGTNPVDNELILIYYQLGWLNEKGKRITGQTEDVYSEMDVGAGNTCEIDLFRESSQHLKTMRWADSGRETVSRISEDSIDHQLSEIGEEILIDRSDTNEWDEELFRQQNNLEKKLLRVTEWTTSEIRVTSSNCKNISRRIDVDISDGNPEFKLLDDGSLWNRSLVRLRQIF